MIRFALLLVLLCALATALLAATPVADTSPIFDIPRLDGITIDGNPADWGDRGFRVGPLLTLEGNIRPADNYDSRFRLGWNDQGVLFVGFVRDSFIEDFWEIRNPARGSGRNPFKDEHYARMEYANEHFGRQTNTPGWKTDMGRTYILFGKPASRAPFTGYGQIYPLELWFYSNNGGSASLPPYFYVLFFMPNDIGEYRFYHPFLDGPMKLVRGSQFRTNRDVYRFLNPLGGDLARAAFTLIPGEPLDTQDYQPSMAAEMLVNKLQNFANDSFNVERIHTARELRAQVSSWFLVNQERPLDLSDIVLRDFAGSYWLDYAVLVDDPALGRANTGNGELTVDFRVRLLSESGETVMEDREDATSLICSCM
jgi:GWxTD domain-containing protein